MRLPRKIRALVIGTDRDSSKNYMAKALKLVRSMGIEPGKVFDVTVVHDDECAALQRKGHCDCDPIVVPGTPEEFHGGKQ